VNGTDGAQEMRRELGRRLRELRRQAGLSQQQVARQTGYTRSAISNAEAGGYAHRRFWEQCDDLLGGEGELTRGYDEIHQRHIGSPGDGGNPGLGRETIRQT
jgi:transcriptional regulator with XRE-family HTH domain